MVLMKRLLPLLLCAAVLACGDRALLSHHSAAAVWGIRPLLDGDIDITVVGKETGRRRKGIQLHRTKTLQPRDATRHQQLPITSPARTLLDIAPHTSPRSLEWAIDQALTKRLTNHAAIRAVLAAYPHAAGIARLRELTNPDRPTTLTRSQPEERLLQRIRKTGLPIPKPTPKSATTPPTSSGAQKRSSSKSTATTTTTPAPRLNATTNATPNTNATTSS